jgi:HD-GYP domain-containing protein (c-di-GMP phosphodiesterase class II)
LDRSYFSVSYQLIVQNQSLPYDLFVNSSSLASTEKFVRVFPIGEFLTIDDLKTMMAKYHQLYVPEEQRETYVRSLVHSEQFDDVEKTTVIKDAALKYLHTIFEPDKEFNTELLSETISACRETVESMIDVLGDYSIDSLRGLIGNLSFHDFYTYDHSINVSMYCITILRALKPNATRSELMHAGLGGLLHDLGKIKIPTHILNKPGKLLSEEYEEIQKHPTYGIDLLLSDDCQVSEDIDLQTIARIVHEHHENWNGTGYPKKLKEKEIHLLARICAIADFFDAITTKRSYSEILPMSKAIEVMRNTSGTKLDPKLFDIFTKHVEYSNVTSTKQLKLADHFDPTLFYEKLPLEEIEELFTKKDFGKIRIIDEKKKV